MTSFLTSLYLLSFKQCEIEHSSDIDCVKVSSKNVCTQGSYSEAKAEFHRSRCSDTKNQWKGKKSIKSIEKLFKSFKCIYSSWESNQSLLLFYSNGSMASIELNSDKNTLVKLEIDESLNGKFLPSRIVDAIMCMNHIFVTYSEPKLTHISFKQEPKSLSAKLLGKKKGKVVGFDPIISHIDLIGPASKNLERKLSLNSCKDHLLIWWKFTGDDVWPWTPVAYSTDRVNILIYKLERCLEILCTVKVNGDLINAKFSNLHSNHILTIEEVKTEKDICINVSVYEILRDQCHHSFISRLPIQGQVVSFDWSPSDKLLISDSNCQLLIYDLRKKSSLVTNLLFIPFSLAWHPHDCIALVSGPDGQLQCFDSALTSISFKLFYKTVLNHKILNLSSHFSQNISIHKMLWQKFNQSDSCLLFLDSEMASFLILKFSLGNITKSCLTALEVISQYLKANAIDESILLLRNLDWWNANEHHFQCLSKIANCLLRKPLNLQTLSGLELTLGTFYKNIDILPKRFIRIYEHKVTHIARRFFHHLLRHHQFRKAFLLAVDLESHDLFLDLSHVAKEKGQTILALVAIHKANELESSQNSCSESSCSSTGTSEDSGSDYENDNWLEGKSPYFVPKQNSFDFESSAQQYMLPIADRSKLTNNWINSSETTNYQSLHEQTASKILHPSSNSYIESLAPYNTDYSDLRTDTPFTDRTRGIPQLQSKPLPNPPNYSVHSNHILNANNSNYTYTQAKHSKTYLCNLSEEKDDIQALIPSDHQNSIKDDNDIEEVGDSKIKLVHFGII